MYHGYRFHNKLNYYLHTAKINGIAEIVAPKCMKGHPCMYRNLYKNNKTAYYNPGQPTLNQFSTLKLSFQWHVAL